MSQRQAETQPQTETYRQTSEDAPNSLTFVTWRQPETSWSLALDLLVTLTGPLSLLCLWHRDVNALRLIDIVFMMALGLPTYANTDSSPKWLSRTFAPDGLLSRESTRWSTVLAMLSSVLWSIGLVLEEQFLSDSPHGPVWRSTGIFAILVVLIQVQRCMPRQR